MWSVVESSAYRYRLAFAQQSGCVCVAETLKSTAHDTFDHLVIAFGFAVRTVKLCERIASCGFGARHIANQLIRCSTSVGANAEEAQEGQSKADYIAKMSVSSKEARESGYWLRLAVAAACVSSDEVQWELKEANELRFMIRAAIRTARSSSDRGRNP
jgi:four helix bundle protein